MLLLLLLLEKDLRNLPYIIFIQDQHLPLSLFIHWTNMRGKCPTHNQCDDIFSATSSTLHHQIHEGAHPNFHSCPTAPAATQRLSSPTTFRKVVPSESPPTTKPRSSQDFFWAWKNLRFLFQHKGGTMENIPPIHLLHFLKWKCTSPEKFIIDPSDKARILVSWVHPKVKHAIPEIQRNLFGVSNIRLGYWEITQKEKSSPWQNSEHFSGRFLSKNLFESAILSDSYVAKPVDKRM